MKSMASYLYKAIDNESIIKNVWGICLDLGLKTQNTLKKLAVQKANPSKQGLKPDIEVAALANEEKVQKANPSKQGLKQGNILGEMKNEESKRLIHQNKD